MTSHTWNIFEVGPEAVFFDIRIGEESDPEEVCRRDDWIGRLCSAEFDEERREPITAIVNLNLVELTIVIFLDVERLYECNLYHLILFSYK